MSAGEHASGAIPVLLYHSVSDVPAPGQEPFTVTPARFAEHVAAIADTGRTPLTISELAAGLRGERELPRRAVAVTFDDGFIDTLAAVELLTSRAISSTVFVTSGCVGLGNGVPRGGVLALAGAGAEIGAHTVTHPYLDEVAPPRAAQELRDSRAALEAELGAPVSTFAYPHGAYDRRVRAAVRDAGYTSAAAVKNALSHPRDDPFAIARWTVMGATTTDAIEAILEGRGAPLAWARERVRTRAYRAVRRLRRRIRPVGPAATAAPGA